MAGVSLLWEKLGALPAAESLLVLPTAAVLVPLYEDTAGEVRVVLTKRPDHMSTHAGQLAFPGGRLEESDAGPVDAALREAEEEVALAPASVEVLGVLAPVSTNRQEVVVVPVVGRLAAEPELFPDPKEVELILRPPMALFFEESRWRTEMWSGHELWFIEVDDEILWGATARIMRDLLSAVRAP